MFTDYNDVLKRLKEERCRLNLSQSDMGKLVPMSQGNYSKIELGQRRFSFYELLYLCKTGVDIHYIFTGQKCKENRAEFLLRSEYSDLVMYAGIIYWIAVPHKKCVSKDWDISFDKEQYVPLIMESRSSENVFYTLRRVMDYQQLKMAKTLGIDIKKLRELENGRSLPDSELLYRLYDLFLIPPSVVLHDKDSLISELSVLLEKMSEECRQEVERFLTALRNIDVISSS